MTEHYDCEMREYECEFYKVLAPVGSCLFCDHCRDVFWDYSNGPYLFLCDVGADTTEGAYGRCQGFKENA